MDMKILIWHLFAVNSEEIPEIERFKWIEDALLKGFLVMYGNIGIAIIARWIFISFMENSVQFPYEIS